MLVQFSVKNYKSFKEKVTFSMVAAKLRGENDHPENVISINERNLQLLKSAAIYGANASGKSNLIQAFGFIRWFILNSATGIQREDSIAVVPFRLDSEFSKQPSEFEIVFISNKERYVYGFSCDAERIHEEWLTAARKTRSRL
ncbi:MAG: AAA family ATPase, partial [bacterium]